MDWRRRLRRFITTRQIRRACLLSLIRNQTLKGSTAGECAVPAGLLSDSIRPRPERLGTGQPILRVVRIARRAEGARFVCDSRIGFTRSRRRAEFSVAPFYHFNQADYDSRANDFPVATTWHQTSNYVGGQADVRADVGPNNFSGGLYSFYQGENDLFGLAINDKSYCGEQRSEHHGRIERGAG